MGDDQATTPELAERLGISRRAATVFVVARFPDLDVSPELRRRAGKHRDAAISRAALSNDQGKGGR